MTKRVNITLPENVLLKLDELAVGSDMDRSSYIQMLIRNDAGESNTHAIHTPYTPPTPLRHQIDEAKVIKTPEQALKAVRAKTVTELPFNKNKQSAAKLHF